MPPVKTTARLSRAPCPLTAHAPTAPGRAARDRTDGLQMRRAGVPSIGGDQPRVSVGVAGRNGHGDVSATSVVTTVFLPLTGPPSQSSLLARIISVKRITSLRSVCSTATELHLKLTGYFGAYAYIMSPFVMALFTEDA